MIKLDEIIASKNVAELLEPEQLAEIGNQAVLGYEIDEESRIMWKEQVDEALLIAKQTREPKNTPWPGASNVKYPLITQAAVDYASRTIPQIIQNENVVKATVIGADLDEEKDKRGKRVSMFMSHQLINQDLDWQEGTDKLFHILPVLGTVFRKTYFDVVEDRPISELCVPDDIVVNYNISSLDSARRITHILRFYQNDIVERVRAGLYLDIPEDELIGDPDRDPRDQDAAIEVLEQHCYLDLDEDGYKEPYIVTLHKNSRKVLRIVHRIKEEERNSKGEVIKLAPRHYFTDYHFIRSPDGGFYSMGFGTLLLPLNSSINTIINQLIDAGTLNSMQGGFIGRGLRIKNGEFRIKMGEWKVLDAAAGTDIAKSVFPMPTKEPSPVLFQLLGLLLEAGRDLASINDAMSGKSPAQNVAQGTVSTLIEQGSKILNAVNQRIHRALRREYLKLFEINAEFLTDEEYQNVTDDPMAFVEEDFDLENIDILPVADPSFSTSGQKLLKADAVAATPGVDPHEAGRFRLESLQLPDYEIDKLLPKPDPKAPPPPEVQKILAEIKLLEAEAAVAMAQAQIQSEGQMMKLEDIKIRGMDAAARVNESEARIEKMQNDINVNATKTAIAGSKADQEAMMDELVFEHKKEKDALDAAIAARKLDLDFKKAQLQNKPEEKTSKDSKD